MSVRRLVFLAPSEEVQTPSLIVDDKGAIFGREPLQASATLPTPMSTIVVVPGEDVLVRWIEFGAATPTQAAAAAPQLLKDDIAAPPETLHFAVGNADDHGFRPVCIIDRARLQSYLARAAALGVKPVAAVPDHLLLPAPKGDAVRIGERGALRIVRAHRLAFCGEAEMVARVLAGKSVKHAADLADIDAAFAAGSASLAVNLLQGEFAVNRAMPPRPKDLRRVASLAAALILSPLILWSVMFVRYELAAKALEAKSVALASAIPGADSANDPARYLMGRLDDLSANARFLEATRALFAGVANVEGVELEDFAYLQEGIIRATLLHSEASAVPTLATSLNEAGLVLREDSSEEKDGRFSTAITLETRR